jgi:hypothetical protein
MSHGAGMNNPANYIMSNTNTPAPAPAPSTAPAKDWSKELMARKALPRFNAETVLLCQLFPKATTDEVKVKAIDWMRAELAKLASDSANSGELGKVSKLSKKDGTRKITVKGEAIERRETVATWVARIAKVRSELAKEVKCSPEFITIPADSGLVEEVESLIARLSK